MDIKIVAFIILLFLSAFFSSSETAIFSTNPIKLETYKNNKNAKLIQKFLEKPADVIATILLGNEFVNVTISALGTILILEYLGEEYLKYSVIIIILILLIFGEVTPKTIAVKLSEKLAFKIAPILNFLIYLFGPLRKILVFAAQKVVNLFGIDLYGKAKSLSEEEFLEILKEAKKEGLFKDREVTLIEKAIYINDLPIKNLMIPRKEIYAIDIEDDMKTIVEKIINSPYNRIPVFKGDLDEILGVLIRKKFLPILMEKNLSNLTKEDIFKALEKPLFVPEFKKTGKVLEEMQKTKKHTALIINEYGNLAGLTTLKDILNSLIEEKFYEIDEIQKISPHTYLVDPTLPIELFEKFFNLKLPASYTKEIDTLSGLIMNILGRIPKEGDEIILKNLKIKVEKMDQNKISKVKVIKKE